MGLSGCYAILKYLLVLFNVVFGIIGIAGTVFAIWMFIDPEYSLSVTQDYIISLVIILIASLVLIILSIFGLIGAIRENSCALSTFFSLLLIIFVAEVSTGVWIHINRDSIKMHVKSAVEYTVEHEYYQQENRRKIFDTFQHNLQCCGANSPSDWMGSKQVLVTVTSSRDNYSIPMSCCRENVAKDLCRKKTQYLKSTDSIDLAVIYEDGCYDAILAKLKEYSFCILVVGIVIAVVQVLGMIFALILAFAVNRSNRYKA